MVTVGNDVAGRYRVAAVGPDAVELDGSRDGRYSTPCPKVTSLTSLIARAARSSSTARAVRLSSLLRSVAVIQVHDADGADAAAAECEAADIDLVPAENRADLADDAGLVLVADDEQRARAFERRLDVDAVQLSQPRTVALEHGPFNPPFASGRLQLHRQHVGKRPRARAARFDDFDAPLGRDRARVHDRHVRRQHRPEEPGDHRARR